MNARVPPSNVLHGSPAIAAAAHPGLAAGLNQPAGVPFETWMNNALRRVAPISPWALELLSMSPDADGNERRLTELIASDPALLARILGTANGMAFNPRGHRVTDVGLAIRRLGTREVWRIAASVALGTSSRIRPELRAAKRALWLHSFTAAHAARMLAEAGSALELSAERVFVATLLHDIGLMVLLSVEPQKCAQMLPRIADPVVGFSAALEAEAGLPPHALIGAEACRRWGLPEDVIALIESHSEAAPSLPEGLQADAAAMALGHHIAESVTAPPGLYRLRPALDTTSLRASIGLEPSTYDEVVASLVAAGPRIAALAAGA